jgi:hypothetical protein
MKTAMHVVRPVGGRIPPDGGTSDGMPGEVPRLEQRLKTVVSK